MMKSETLHPKRKYSAMTMVETLITLLIVGVVLIVVSTTLTALIKASAISSARTLSRNESEFVLEILERYIENAQSDEIFLYKVNPADRYIDLNGDVVDNAAYVFDLALPGEAANEVHIRPIGSNEWVCLAYYPGVQGSLNDPDDPSAAQGYIVKNTSFSQDEACMTGGSHVFLTSDEVNINDLSIKATPTAANNFIFVVDLTLEPIHWVPGPQSKFKPQYTRQLVVSTEKLTF